jgi:EAL domain-containing protein (putative c-di-GMP-specific phosphodiesterase class I)
MDGDQFAVLVENILTASEMDIVADRILQEMKRPFDIFGHSVDAGASIGMATAGSEHSTPELLIRDADFAMHRAKLEGGGRFAIFDKRLELQSSSQKDRERELRHVLGKRQYEIWYQPIYRLSDGKIRGFESQLRWCRPDGSVDSARSLLSLAEDTGLSISIGRETLDAVCKQLRSWLAGLPQPDLTLTVNVTQRQFYHPEMIPQLRKTLLETGIEPSRLLFEISETTLNENPDAAVAILHRIVEFGVRVAVDDFGSSLGSLNQLVQLPIDVVKMDPRLTRAVTAPSRQLALVQSLVQLGRSLEMQVVAQGIETSEQLDALCGLGCELGQGQLLSAPLDADQAQNLARRNYWSLLPGA